MIAKFEDFKSKYLIGKSETETRMRSAAFGIFVLLVLLVVGGHFGSMILALIISAGMILEFSKSYLQLIDRKEKTQAMLGIAWLMLFINFLFPKATMEIIVISFMGLFIYFLLSAERHAQALESHFKELVFSVFTLIYIVVFMSYLPQLRSTPHGLRWVFLFLVINWACDTAAYFGGRKFGKTRLFPLISPKKTVVGAVMGVLGGMAAAVLFKLIFFHAINYFAVLTIGFVISTFSQVGDLCESFFKRAYGIKDSGQFLPGHGGFLDRFDGILFTLPLMYACSKLFIS